jgi:Tfp pilus assembly protein PilV
VGTRVREEGGWGLIELLMAMVMLNIGILAVVASFNSGAVAIRRASMTATAATLADSQMELYRGLKYASIALDDTTTKTLTDTTYRADSVLAGNVNNSVTTTGCTAPLANECNPSRVATGADRRQYRVDTYVTVNSTTNGRQVKLVTVVVRRPASPYGTLVRQQSTFDASTGA